MNVGSEVARKRKRIKYDPNNPFGLDISDDESEDPNVVYCLILMLL